MAEAAREASDTHPPTCLRGTRYPAGDPLALTGRRLRPWQWLVHRPDHHVGFDLLLPQRPGDRDAMMPIPHKVELPNADQLNQRQRHPPLLGLGDAHPALLAVTHERVEVAIKIP